MDHTMIADFAKDQTVDDYYVCVKKIKKLTKNGDEYIFVILSDRSGRIEGRMWKESIERFGDSFEASQVVRIKGKVSDYDGKMQLILERAGIGDATKFDKSWFLPQSPFDLDQAQKEIQMIMGEVEGAQLKELVKAFFDDEQLAENFKVAPGAVSIHHAYIGGLMVHTLGVLKLCKAFCGLYPSLSKDVLLCAALFHDTGKMFENTWDLMFQRTLEGELVGHLIISRDILKSCIAKVSVEPNIALALEHAVLSHHGQYEYGSPKLPMTREACVLHLSDLADSRIEEFESLLKNIPPGESTEPVKFLEHRRLFNI